jgi:4-diphosphocytidyl-2-C-methyl-D-erythritol kinase
VEPPASSFAIRAPAKVNLYLAVIARLPDGYHCVETVIQAVSLWDEVALAPAQDITLTCDEPGIPTGEDNLCYRAAVLLGRRLPPGSKSLGVAIALRKRIPAQAGLGGGSSDAAATLVGLNRMWGLRLRRDELAAVAAQIGADVPFFLRGGTALGTDRGQVLTALGPAPSLHLVLARSGPGVSTAWAYSRCAPTGSEGAYRPMVDALYGGSASAVANALRNDLETAVLPERPDIVELKDALRRQGALGVLMSGSGSAVLGIFVDGAAAQETAAVMRKKGAWARAVRGIRTGVRFAAGRIGGQPGPR